MVVEFIDTTVKEVFHLDRSFLAPLALTIFVWVFLMNAMDLLPLDLPGKVAGLFGIHYWRVVPTADVNTTFAMSLTVLRRGAVLQRQGQGRGRLRARAVHRAVRRAIRCCGSRTSS